MTEYIEKNKAIKELYEVYDYEFPTASGSFDEYARMIVPNTIKNMPAADVAPVRHGQWLCIDTDTEQFFLCNRCKKKEYWESDYCPNCGCLMDGGAD